MDGFAFFPCLHLAAGHKKSGFLKCKYKSMKSETTNTGKTNIRHFGNGNTNSGNNSCLYGRTNSHYLGIRSHSGSPFCLKYAAQRSPKQGIDEPLLEFFIFSIIA